MSASSQEVIGGQGHAEQKTVQQSRFSRSSQWPQPVLETSAKRVVDPPAAAKNRSDLAESLPWFQRHQGGLYYKQGTIHGILLLNDEFGGLGHFHDRVLITRLARQTNQKASSLSTVARAALNTLQRQNMIGVVISRDFQKLSVTFGNEERFGVSGFWHLSKLFAVKSKGPKESEVHTDLMACLAYSGRRETMWWASNDDEVAQFAVKVIAQGETFDDNFVKQPCSTCSESSTTIFQEGWVCTNMTCTNLGKNNIGHVLTRQTYVDELLVPRLSQRQLAQTPPPLLPKISKQTQLTDDVAENSKIMRDFWRGWVCSVCHTMNRRKDYHKLVCTCGQSFISGPPSVSLDQVAGKEFLALKAGGEFPQKAIKEDVVHPLSSKFTDEFAIYTWDFSPEARVTALYPRAAAHTGPKGIDAVFNDLQEKMRTGAIPMARVGFVDDTGRKVLTRNFCANFGQQYYASMKISTTSFEEADPIISDLVCRAKAIVVERLGIEVDFNETLCLAYLPDMSMGWHNDGETGLKDVIVSHSFGANCEMKFAMKGAYWAGKKPTTTSNVVLAVDDPHLRGCLKMDERRALLEKHQKGEMTKEIYEAELRKVVRQNTVSREAVSPTLLRLTVPHGGYVIMHGKNMQRYYQHSAESTGLMRFVLTMRQIGGGHEERTKSTKGRAATETQRSSSQQPVADEPFDPSKGATSTASDPVLGKRKRGSA